MSTRHTKRTEGHLHSTSLLPVIKGAKDVDPYERPENGQAPAGPPQGWGSPRIEIIQDTRSASRMNYLENRLLDQDKTIQALLERAYRIKEDIIDSLNLTHGTWQEEKHSRELLQDHVRTITNVVGKLSRDIAVLDDQIKSRLGSSQFTQDSVKNLEMHHVAGVTDLRGRVARCDASIAKLSADLKGLLDANRSSNQFNQGKADKLADQIVVMDRKIHDLMGKLDKVYAEHELQIKHMGSDSSQKVITLDAKTKALIDDLRNSLREYQANERVEREKLEGKLSIYVENAAKQQDAKLEQLEQKLVDTINNINLAVAKIDEELRKERERNEMANKALEAKLNSQLNIHLKKQSDELAKLKVECREGFTTVQESIVNMKKVMDGKYRILEEQIKREISSIRKMVVLI